MWSQDLVRDLQWNRVNSAVAAGTSATTSTYVDTQDYDGVVFVASLSGVLNTSVVTAEISECATSGGTYTLVASTLATYTNSSGSTVTGLILTQVYRPLLRYCKVVITPSTANAAIDCIMAMLYNGRVSPAYYLTNAPANASATGVLAYATATGV
jgi:hypothetical protein